MDNYDVKDDLGGLYRPRKGRFELVDVPTMQFLTGTGSGNPNTAREYQAVVKALYATSYAIRARSIETLGRKFTVGPLEGIWWAEDLRAFTSRDQDEWNWTMMIHQPAWVDGEIVKAARERAKTKTDPAAVEALSLQEVTEGQCAQILYFGPYKDEGPTIVRLHDFVRSEGYELRGRHHEVYLGDPRRSKPSRLRTILRQPVRSRQG